MQIRFQTHCATCIFGASLLTLAFVFSACQGKSPSTPEPATSQPIPPTNNGGKPITGDALQDVDVEPDPNHAPAGSQPWDMSYLLKLDPNQVTSAQMAAYADWADRNYWKYHQVNGVTYVGKFTDVNQVYPVGYKAGGDAALFTGAYLAAASFRYAVTKQEADLDKMLRSLRGIHYLSHISGQPGVLARVAFPLEVGAKFGYPEEWKNKLADGVGYESDANVPDAFAENGNYPKSFFYTRTSKDQVTGVMYGLSVAQIELERAKSTSSTDSAKFEKARALIRTISNDMLAWNEKNGFTIKDQTGKKMDSANSIDGMLRIVMYALKDHAFRPVDVAVADAARSRAKKLADDYFGIFGGQLNEMGHLVSVDDYFVFNLSFMRNFAAYLLMHNISHGSDIASGVRSDWAIIRTHQNPHFAFINATLNGGTDGVEDGVRGVKALAIRPARAWSSAVIGPMRKPSIFEFMQGQTAGYTLPVLHRAREDYFLWQKPPWRIDETPGIRGETEVAGEAYLLTYWFGRMQGIIK